MKSIKIKNYTITFGKDGEYSFFDIPEEVCQNFVDCEDRGPRYSNDSRYTYSIEGLDNLKGIGFGTAKVVIQTLLKKQKGFDIFNDKVTISYE